MTEFLRKAYVSISFKILCCDIKIAINTKHFPRKLNCCLLYNPNNNSGLSYIVEQDHIEFLIANVLKDKKCTEISVCKLHI